MLRAYTLIRPPKRWWCNRWSKPDTAFFHSPFFSFLFFHFFIGRTFSSRSRQLGAEPKRINAAIILLGITWCIKRLYSAENEAIETREKTGISFSKFIFCFWKCVKRIFFLFKNLLSALLLCVSCLFLSVCGVVKHHRFSQDQMYSAMANVCGKLGLKKTNTV